MIGFYLSMDGRGVGLKRRKKEIVGKERKEMIQGERQRKCEPCALQLTQVLAYAVHI